ncbi:MAG: O-antigen ligase family protein [Clostridiales bacterium]|jgi:hypothetical protein|nr:O-antigen ligase family protein [Clostridiales bacterium]
MSRAKRLFSGLTLTERVHFISFILILAVMPLATLLHGRVANNDEAWLVQSGMVRDLFTFYKSGLLIAGAALLFLSNAFTESPAAMRRSIIAGAGGKGTRALWIYLIFAGLSALFETRYPLVQATGIAYSFENIFVLISYTVVFAKMRGFVKSAALAKAAVGVLAAGAVGAGFAGALQTFGFDIFSLPFIKGIICPVEQIKQISDMAVGRVYATFGDSARTGLYASFLLPLFVCFAAAARKSAARALSIIASVLLAICLIGAPQGLYPFIASSAAGLGLLALREKKANAVKRRALYFLSIPAAALIVLIAARGFKPFGSEDFFLKDISVLKDRAVVSTSAGDVIVAYSGDSGFYVENGKLMKLTPGADGSKAAEYAGVNGAVDVTLLSQASNICFVDFRGVMAENGQPLYIMLQYTHGAVYPLSFDGFYTDLYEEYPSASLFKETAFGGRGYIWNRTLPLLPKRIVTGAGPDCFAFDFPQDDILGKTRYMGNPYASVIQPKSAYLQTFVNTGAISLAALFCLYAFFLAGTAKAVLSGKTDSDGERTFFGVALGCFCAGVAGIIGMAFTDSSVGVTTIWYAVLGLGFAAAKRAKDA